MNHFTHGLQSLATLLVIMKLASYVPELTLRPDPQSGFKPSIYTPLTLPFHIPVFFTAPIVALLTGIAVFLGLEEGYSFTAALCIAILQWPADSFEQFTKQPWRSTSLSEFWGKRWHAVIIQFHLLLMADVFTAFYWDV
jgi:hypothetical protein